MFSIGVSGQKLTSFSGEPTKFVGELDQLFQLVNDVNRKDCEKKLKEFADLWNTGKFDPEQQTRILALSDQMLKKRVRAYTDFYHYLMALINLQGSQQTPSNFNAWIKGMETLLEEKSQRRFLSFLELSITLFGDNLLYQSGSTIWKARNRSFTIVVDTVPYLIFQNTDLTCFSSRDSLNIYATSGIFFPTLNLWKGKGGKVTWMKSGLDAATVYALLSNYEIFLRFSQYKADSVQLINQLYFKAPLEGMLEDKVMTISSSEKATYPRFSSYEKTITFPNIFKQVNYEGGFEMEGAQVIGSGEKKGDAKLTIFKDQKLLMKVNAKHFIIRKDRIDASKAAVVIYMIHDTAENLIDSIFHPGLQMKYLDGKKEISLSGEESFTTKTSPFFDSYHKVDIYCEGIVWDITKPLIDFKAISATNREGKAVIESANFYAERRYDNLQGLDEQNPLYLLKNMSLHAKTRDFSLDEVRGRLQKPPEQVEALLIRLSYHGYLIYDSDDKRVILKDKLFDYIDAKNKKKDYDMISFSSVITGKSNATLNMANNDLLLRGVPEINVSDSQRVAIFPANQELVLRGNRDMVFTGKVEAGLFDFYAKDCSFDYAGFKFNMPVVDSMAIFVFSRKRDEKGQYPLVKVKSVIADLSGELLIDHPSNKSGVKAMKDYPEFTSRNSSSVFYDNKKIQDGAYHRDQFYYEVLPFNMKGIDRLPTDSIRFRGRLVSAGIFPDIEKPLIVQDDYSLGFNLRTTKDGLPIYEGKGTFISDLSLSNKGLKGDGTYHYLASTSQSKDITFLPELLKSSNTRFTIQEQQLADVAFPAVTGDSLNGRWYPKSDSLTMTTAGKMMAMYKDLSLFDGTLALTPAGLTGEGMIRIGDADMDSKRFKFGKRVFDANIANFRIKSYDLK
ncbi:MAG: hypothetical protein FJY10_09455, partial [Bacteroidetes bacterium]|nr:hypothetical protein [Bacteroidota bacterium]